MNIEMTDLDMILNHLETTSLEPHDDYSSELTYKDQKILYKYIKQLEQENKQLKEVIDNIAKCFSDGHFEDGCDCLIIEKYIDKCLKEVSE